MSADLETANGTAWASVVTYAALEAAIANIPPVVWPEHILRLKARFERVRDEMTDEQREFLRIVFEETRAHGWCVKYDIGGMEAVSLRIFEASYANGWRGDDE